jgi:pyruvate,water dikinase
MSCEGTIGPDGEQILATLLQGFENGSASAGAGLGEVAEVAARHPEIAAALRDERHDDLRTAEGGTEFVKAFDDYLSVYGWRAESWGLPHVLTWCEQPSVPLLLIGRYLKDGATTPATAIQRARLQREEAMREVESRLSGDALADFKDKLAAIQIHVPISEGRAHWQLTIIGSFRVPALALGRKLIEQGVLDEANDVFYLSLGELKETARNGGSQKEVVRQRKADLARWEGLTPPPFLGTPPTAIPEEMQIITSKFFGLGVVQSEDKRIVTGNPASRGVAKGHARVIRDLSDAARLEKGDILVCTSTAPPWTPLFAIAAAIVTDTGGILSHSAICAREYGIPCVVGTQVGTRQIPDGAMITVDGAAGTVRIED